MRLSKCLLRLRETMSRITILTTVVVTKLIAYANNVTIAISDYWNQYNIHNSVRSIDSIGKTIRVAR